MPESGQPAYEEPATAPTNALIERLKTADTEYRERAVVGEWCFMDADSTLLHDAQIELEQHQWHRVEDFPVVFAYDPDHPLLIDVCSFVDGEMVFCETCKPGRARALIEAGNRNRWRYSTPPEQEVSE